MKKSAPKTPPGHPSSAAAIASTTTTTAGEAMTRQAAATQALAALTPFNANKAGEFGRAHAIAPPTGATAQPSSPLATASTLSEGNASAKTGAGAGAGASSGAGASATHDGASLNPGALDRVRSNNDGQVLTTNQGVAIGDNQNSLKAGLRGPTLLEDFILREKITHFDHERIPERIVHAPARAGSPAPRPRGRRR